ncbi:MAG TPA: 2,3-bisphosphoglycerate-independent phosphoglycerate mutase [Longimicrobiaceae bacterium]|nr:2,3-bisphosphoglycerate-independent phosphoglycerate mutase [Longimicrobiaceae bacterium]
MTDAPTPASGRTRVCLVILDGWGLREDLPDNAVTRAKTPTWDAIWSSGKHARGHLTTHGPAVGLPEGQMGNSEVGHLNLGAGRVVMQSLLRIHTAIASGELAANPVLLHALEQVRTGGGTLHLMGLVGSGGVHAEDEHLVALAGIAAAQGVERVRVHAFLDGRDTPPRSGREFLSKLLPRLGAARVATVQGRYWAMDRDRRWERTEKAYRAMVEGRGVAVTDPVSAIAMAYEAGDSDEFIEPRVVVDSDGNPVGTIRDGDAVLIFNFRADRVRQISRALADPEFDGFDRGTPPRLQVAGMTQYDEDFDLPALFPPQPMTNILAEVLERHGLRGFRTAETEKYPHVTYFFNGGLEEAPRGEDRRMVPSPKVATYDLQPEMSADAVAAGLVDAIRGQTYDVLVCNFANPDMVGHTGVLAAAIRAVETVDRDMAGVVQACTETGTALLVTADHGNCEQMWDPVTSGPHTAHTTHPVGIVLVEPDDRRTAAGLRDGALCDVAPTILGLLGVPQPEEMTGRDLRVGAAARA